MDYNDIQERLKNIYSSIDEQYFYGREALDMAHSEKTDINSFAWPVRDLLPICSQKTNYATIVASRGCYGRCTFCSNCSFERVSVGPTWRGRDPRNVAEEIQWLNRDYGIKVFKFNDPNIFGPGELGREHVIDLCKEIIKRKMDNLHFMGFCRSNDIDLEVGQLMRQVGFERLLIGVESTDSKILQLFRKGESLKTIENSIRILRSVEISLVPGFMLFNPYTTMETLIKDLDFLEKYGFAPTLSKALRVFDGVPLQKMLIEEERLVWKSPFEGYHEYLINPVIAAIYMALKRVHLEWVELITKTRQAEFWGIKKAPSFKDRQSFDKLSYLIFEVEKDFLKFLICCMQGEFTISDIDSHLSKIRSRLIEIEFSIFPNTTSIPVIDKIGTAQEKLTEEVHSILKNKPFDTLPELYRWGDD